MLDLEILIRRRLVLGPVPGLPHIVMHAAHAGSGLRELIEAAGLDGAPYWAYQWAGGLALAHYFTAHPEIVRAKRILDLGAGSGIVSIAALKAGAASTVAAEIDPFGRVALGLNAAANGVTVETLEADLLDGPPPRGIDLIAVGDLFYEEKLAHRVTLFLERCRATGMDCLVGDPGRGPLPLERLRQLADYGVADVGDQRQATGRSGKVFAFD